MSIVLILFLLLILEEILHRLNRGPSFMNIDLAGDSVEQVEQNGQGRLTRLLSWMRILQLLVFGLLFAVIAATSGVNVINTSSGQLAGLALLIQAVRWLNRKVINQWAVLGVTVILQVLLLVLLMMNGISPADPTPVVSHEGGWMVSLASFLVLFLLTVTMPFIGTFFLRLFSREGSGFYYFLPSLAYSEYWIKRLTRVSAGSALAFFLMIILLIIRFDYPPGTSILHIVPVLLLYTAASGLKNRSILYHPLAVFLVFVAWAVNICWLILHLSSISSGWIA
jgi:hypothetical protein